MDTFIQRPLADILVIALEQAVAAPFATRQLADLGARVIKIERPEVGDFARHYDQTVHGMASHFVWLNRSKESLALNLKDPQGLAVIEHLLAKAAHRFVEQGAQVVVVDLDEHKVANVVHELGSACSFGFVADVTNEERISQLVASTLERFGKIDIYYNNAGIPLSSTPIEMLDLATWQRIMDVNTTAIFLAAKAVLPHMKSQGGGSIIVTASTAGIRPRPGLSAYNASKGAAILLTKSLASELAPFNIRVNAICPVAANTPMLEQFGFGTTREEAVQRFTATIPLGHLVEPDDVAQAALYLASDEARNVTGITLEVDGGRSI